VDRVKSFSSPAYTKYYTFLVSIHTKTNKVREKHKNDFTAVGLTGLRAVGAPMESDRVIIVLARYDTRPPHGPVEWYGPGNTVQHAYKWLQAHRSVPKMDDSEPDTKPAAGTESDGPAAVGAVTGLGSLLRQDDRRPVRTLAAKTDDVRQRKNVTLPHWTAPVPDPHTPGLVLYP
jgi:hypothetical protein